MVVVVMTGFGRPRAFHLWAATNQDIEPSLSGPRCVWSMNRP